MGFREDQETLREMMEAFKALIRGEYTIDPGVVGEPDAKSRYLEDPAAADGFSLAYDRPRSLINAGALKDNHQSDPLAVGLFGMLKRENIYEWFTRYCAGAVAGNHAHHADIRQNAEVFCKKRGWRLYEKITSISGAEASPRLFYFKGLYTFSCLLLSVNAMAILK